MAANTQLGNIQLRRLDRRGIVSVLCQRPMARLAGNSFVHAFALYVEDIGMAALADLMSRVGNRERCDLGDCLASIVSVLPKATRDEEVPQHQEGNNTHQEDGCQPEEVSRIFEPCHNGKYFKLFVRYKNEVSACRVPDHKGR